MKTVPPNCKIVWNVKDQLNVSNTNMVQDLNMDNVFLNVKRALTFKTKFVLSVLRDALSARIIFHVQHAMSGTKKNKRYV